MEVKDIMTTAHATAVEKGWYDDPPTFPEQIALGHSEYSEALEDFRNGRGLTEIYYEGEKPCGIPVELADVVIRVCDVAEYQGIDLVAAIEKKLAYNATRPAKHGGKKL